MVLGYHRFSPRSTEDTWDRDEDGGDEESCHYGESEDPLEGNDLSQELPDAERSGEDAKCETHRVILLHIISRVP